MIARRLHDAAEISARLDDDSLKLNRALNGIPLVEQNAPGWEPPPEIQTYQKQVRSDEHQLEVVRMLAMREILVAYDIVGAWPDGTPRMPRGLQEFQGLPKVAMTWGVFARPAERSPTYLANGEPFIVPPAGQSGDRGLTTAQGHTFIPDKMFAKSDTGWDHTIHELAITLAHEEVHFEQFSDPRRANESSATREIEALQRDLGCLRDFGLSAEELSAEKQNTQYWLEKYREKAARAQPSQAYAESRVLETPAENEGIKAASQDFEQEVELQLQQERHRGAAAGSVLPAARAMPITVPAQAIDWNAQFSEKEKAAREDAQWLRALAFDVCSNPDRLTVYNVPGAIGEHWDNLRRETRWLRDHGRTPPVDETGVFEGLAACERALLSDMTARVGDSRWWDIEQDKQASAVAAGICRSFRGEGEKPFSCRGPGCKGGTAPSADGGRDIGHLGSAYGQLQRWPH